MCCDVGKKSEAVRNRPNYEEIASMGCDKSMCAGCELYGWYMMLGDWQPLDGWCGGKLRFGHVRADEPKCNYFVERGDLRCE